MTSITRFHPRASACSGAAIRRRPALDDLSDAAQFIVWTFRRLRQRIRERDQLALAEGMLSDIGLSRAEAEYLAIRPFWRD